ncbi:MAG TPA: YbaK/EbsC family protein, partial [Geobacteraceae bacterium]
HIERAQHAAPLRNVLPASLGAVVRSFKSACSKRINELRNTPGLPVWQRNYHERVIRTDGELHALRDYIHNNPARWEEDPERYQDMETAGNDREPFRRLMEIVERSGVPFSLHEHRATRTVEEAEQNLSFEVARIVKTVAFRTRSGGIVLAAVRGIRRVDYARLAPLVGVNRRDLAALSPEEVREELGVEPGSVSPLPLRDDALVLIDEDVLTILPTLYCGIGRSDRTLEIAPDALVRLTHGRVGGFSREGK